MAIKIVFCPNCTRKIYLTWNTSVGVFRGSCPKCSCLIYARDTGRAWVNRGNRKWIAIVNDAEQYKLDVPLKIHLLFTEMKKTEFIGLIESVWDDLIGFITGSGIVTTGEVGLLPDPTNTNGDPRSCPAGRRDPSKCHG